MTPNIDLDKFVDAYIAAALWSSADDNGDPFDSWADKSDISPESMAAIRRDCEAFIDANAADLFEAFPLYPSSSHVTLDGNAYDPEEYAGHDFWLTRNGHGAGFWDRDLGPVGDRLTAACEKLGHLDVYTGDGGKIYFS